MHSQHEPRAGRPAPPDDAKQHTEFVPLTAGYETIKFSLDHKEDLENASQLVEKMPRQQEGNETDPNAAAAVQKPAANLIGLFGSTANLAKSAISSGLLLFPNLVYAAGHDMIALVFLVVITLCAHFSIVFLGKAAKATQKGDFTGVLTAAFTRQDGHYPLYLRILVNLFAPGIAFVKMAVATRAMRDCMGLFVSSFITKLSSRQEMIVGDLLAAVMLAGIMFPLTFLKDMRRLSTISFAGTAILTYILVITVINYALTAQSARNVDLPKAPLSVDSAYYSFVMMALCFAGHPSVPNIVLSLQRPTARRIFVLSAISMAICATMYGVTGFAGKNTPGLDVSDVFIFTSIRNPGRVHPRFFHLGGLFMSLSLCITGPLVLFPARSAIRTMFGLEKETKKSYHLTNIVISVLSITVGLLPCKINIVTGFMGSLAGMGLVFFMPALAVHRVGKTHPVRLNTAERVFLWLNICIGFLGLLGGLPWTAYRIYKAATAKA